MTDTPVKPKRAAASKTRKAPSAPARSRDPYAADRLAYYKEMIEHDFDPAAAKIIADKTDYASRRRQAREAEQQSNPAALGDFFGSLTPPKPAGLPRPTVLAEAKAAPVKPIKPNKRLIETPIKAVYDYRYEDLPERVKDLIQAHLLIEEQDAKEAGTIGYMARALAIATLPHRRVPDHRFVRRNGDFTLSMITAHPDGLPSGTLPRILLSWVCTEAVRTKEPVLSLGSTLAHTLRELGLKNTGGEKGDITRLKRAMTTLFSAMISCRYEGRDSWALSNVLLADRVEWWQPQDRAHAGQWESKLVLSRAFFQECIDHPVPVNLIAMKALSHSSLALDIYVWLTHRMSYLKKKTLIPWVSLQAQYGSNYAQGEQGLRDFRRAFLRELKKVVTIYPAKVSTSEVGLVLYPSKPHVPMIGEQRMTQSVLPF